MYVWADIIKVIPYIWISVIALVLLTHQPAHIVVNILCNVFLMSIFLTVIGTWIGSRQISLEPIQMFFYKWPRNFAISFGIEALVAQPIARMVMLKMHQVIDAKTDVEVDNI